LTVLGFWNHKECGGIQFFGGEGVVELIPGATIAVPAGTMAYKLLPVAPHERRYIFRQYCHAGVFRWLEKGGRSDKDFDEYASEEEIAAWDERRANRGQSSLKMFSKLGDVFVI
ncbi:hypothetical protein B0H13DRAFT_1618069, partial [Mycena leptocephala]